MNSISTGKVQTVQLSLREFLVSQFLASLKLLETDHMVYSYRAKYFLKWNLHFRQKWKVSDPILLLFTLRLIIVIEPL